MSTRSTSLAIADSAAPALVHAFPDQNDYLGAIVGGGGRRRGSTHYSHPRKFLVGRCYDMLSPAAVPEIGANIRGVLPLPCRRMSEYVRFRGYAPTQTRCAPR